MGKIIKNNVVYGGVPDEVITAWETEDVQDLSEIEYGDADISGIGDGSITGAIAEHESDISTLNSKLNQVPTSYTPTFGITGSGTIPTVNNIGVKYYQVGNLLVVSGRFNITALGSVSTSIGLTISLPTGFTYNGNFGVGAAGFIVKEGTSPIPWIIRNDSNLLTVANATGGYPALTTGYHAFLAFMPIR